ncbi:SWIB/MDM2 domain-containing protein [Altererythrobacter sp. ZODW24]|uniref:SWIB/MDM2 domain-containing protein n=1 Tax=Altererythrobacter sp. ZODW24 TaxID=2185142 RepID=UPI000DF808B7|nr:SWIB/MDM2 domain-containing protein [Altererythrobacter sp. ZODW24]
MAAKNNALNKPVTLTPALEGVIGKGPMTRAQVTSKIWEYIKKHDLQAADDRRMIDADDTLAAVIGKERISMFKMTAAVSKHLS